MRKILFLMIITLTSCHQPDNSDKPKLSTYQLEGIKRTTYKPMTEQEAYDFINQYYLPSLDSSPTKRKIYIHPINLPDLSYRFKQPESKDLSGHILIIPPPPVRINTSFKWDKAKLQHIELITDDELNQFKNRFNSDTNYYQEWHHHFGIGYMSISYPAYNSYIKRIVIRQWFENHTSCGTDRDKLLYYTKTANGWRLI